MNNHQVCSQNILENKNKKETLEIAIKAYKKYKNKYWKSYLIFITLTTLAIFLSSSLIVLNLYSLRWNNSTDKKLIYYFLSMAIGSTAITFLTSFSAFMSFNNKKINYMEATNYLKDTLQKYQNNEVENLKEMINNIATIEYQIKD